MSAGEAGPRARTPVPAVWLEDEDPRPLRWAALAGTVVFAALFLIAWPKGEVDLHTAPVVYVPPTEVYIPPVKDPPKPPEQKVLEQVRKIALPDPTPDKPEPVIQPIIEPPPPPVAPDARVLIGAPRMPPPRDTGPVAEGTVGLVNPQPISRKPPTYPRAAISQQIEGVVVVEAIIDRTGSVKDARVAEGLGFGLDEAAVEAVRNWKFTVGQLEGRPVEVRLRVRVTFKLQ